MAEKIPKRLDMNFYRPVSRKTPCRRINLSADIYKYEHFDPSRSALKLVQLSFQPRNNLIQTAREVHETVCSI
jgi:hypothetical protein